MERPVVGMEAVVSCVDLNHGGQGVARLNGFTLFIPGMLPGEEGLVRVEVVKDRYGVGGLLEERTRSPHRVSPTCPVYQDCGGCQLQHLSYEEQLVQKTNQVKAAMARIGKIGTPVLPTLGMDDPWSYRNKAQFPVGHQDGEWLLGFYAQQSHDLIAVESCGIQSSQINRVLQVTRDLLQHTPLTPYTEENHQGDLRHLLVRSGRHTGELMAVFVTRDWSIPSELPQAIKARVPQLTTVIENRNPQKTNVILGRENRILLGSGTIEDRIGPYRFQISPHSFFQVNPDQTEVLYSKALEFAQLTGDELVLDAYCGIGTISLFLSQKASEVHGIEVVAQATDDAQRNAQINNVNNCHFHTGPVEEVLPRLYKQGLRPQVVVLDPPRKGCEPVVLQTLVQASPQRIVYVSCNPATLARDLGLLRDWGYEAQIIQPVDMFPHTQHVETVVLMSRAENEVSGKA